MPIYSQSLYISDDNPEAAQQLKDDIEAKVATVAEHPKLYRPGRVAGTREMAVRRNYVVVYAEDEMATCSTASTVRLSQACGRDSPSAWEHRRS